jgi:DNA-binding CsgD family transcriptional regulator
MGTKPRERESSFDRLENKTLDARFLTEVCEGLNCSPFEAGAVLQVVKEVYIPWFDTTSTNVPPGKVTLVAISADERAGKSIADCDKVTVCLTVHRGAEDDKLLRKSTAAFRGARIPDLCQEALSQGGLLTREDLAHRIFFVSTRTITRDLAVLREEDPDRLIPLRSTVHDIGPVLTHRTQIVHLALEGKTTTQICNIMHHSPEAVANYLSTFTRCAQLVERDMQIGQIAFLLRRPKGLIRKYVDLLEQCKQDKNMGYHLDELLRIGSGGKKKPGEGGRHG